MDVGTRIPIVTARLGKNNGKNTRRRVPVAVARVCIPDPLAGPGYSQVACGLSGTGHSPESGVRSLDPPRAALCLYHNLLHISIDSTVPFQLSRPGGAFEMLLSIPRSSDARKYPVFTVLHFAGTDYRAALVSCKSQQRQAANCRASLAP